VVRRCPTPNGVGTNFRVGGGRRGEARRAESGVMGFFGRSSQPLPHQLGGLRERCKLPQRGPGRSPGRRSVFLYSESSDRLSQHLSTCCLQSAWLGIRFFRGGYTYQYPLHINSWGCQIPCIPRFRRPCV